MVAQDLLCISFLTLVNSLLGLPWLVAATVRRSGNTQTPKSAAFLHVT
jgi:hypothetical protein